MKKLNNQPYYTNGHSCFLLQYHIVLVTKYRHPIIFGDIRNTIYDKDFISAMQIKHSDFSLTGELLYEWFKDYPIKTMVTLDCIFHNTDRHEKNFGIIRDKEGNCRFAPLFDNGSCLDYNAPTIVNNDMKILQGERKDILERYGEDIEIDEQYAKNVLQSTYEYYNISEQLYERSLKELEYGMSLNNQRDKESYRNPYI